MLDAANMVLAQASEQDTDPITALLTHDYSAVGGWSLFVGLGLFMIVSLVLERLVPGKRVARLEELVVTQAKTISDLTEQNSKPIVSNQITEHFFKETTPKRGEVST